MEKMTQVKQTIPWYEKGLISTLVSPSSSIQDVGQRNQARLLAGVSLLMTVMVTLGIWGSYAAHPNETKVVELAVLAVSALIAYFFSRSRYFVVGKLIFLIAFSAFGYVRTATGTDDPTGAVMMSMPLAFLIGIALLGFKGMLGLAAANMVIPFLLPLFFKGIPDNFAWQAFGQILSMGVLSALVVLTRDYIERDRVNEVRKVNKELQTLSADLEQRVSERTREMSLAAEIGRRVSTMHDLDTLLTEAVDLIGDHFNLYYTQVYLTNSTGNSLILRAGTGEVGRQLLRNGHRLMVDLTSINGSAVVERRPVVVENTRGSLIFRPNTLLPKTRSEMSIPLVSGDRVLGVLDLQSGQADDLSKDKLPIFETLAAQLATALANAELFAQVQLTLAEMEERSRGVAREGWNEYLDGVQAKERIGYAFDQVSVQPLDEPLAIVADPCVLTAPIQVSGEQVGAFQFSADHPWHSEDALVVRTVAQLVAQQVENLRLLGQADRYRQEAEKAVRRLTQQEWGDYLRLDENQKFAFMYAQDQVQSIENGLNGTDSAQNFEIKVQGEKVGEFAFPELKDLAPEDADLIAAVSEQLGAHLENMRLFSTAQEELEERRRTEAALDEQRRTLQAVLDNMPAGVFMVEAPSGKPILSNKKAEEFLGRGISPKASEDNINEVYQAFKFGTEELYPAQEMPIVAGLYGQSKSISDMEVRRPDGSRALLEVTGTPVYADSGQVIASLVMFQDITERYKAELLLASQQRTLQAVLDNMPAGVFMVEAPSGKPILSNKKAEEFLGRGISPKAVGEDLNQVYQAYKYGTGALYPAEEMPIVAGLYGQSKSINDMEVLRPDGSRVLLQVTGTPIKDAEDHVTAAVVLFQDITQTKALQDTIVKRAAELATVSQLATAVSTIQSPDEMLQTVVDLMKTSFELYHAHVYLVNEAGDTLTLTKGAGEVGRQMVTEGRSIPMSTEKSLVARAARTHQGVIVNDVHLDPEFLPHPLLTQTRSEMAIPMIVGDQVLGVLDVQSEKVDRFTGEDISIQTTLSSQVAVALQNARQYAQVRGALSQANLFRQLVEAAGQGIWVTTLESDIIYANPAAAKMLDEKPGELMKRAADYIPPEEDERIAADLLGSLRATGQWGGELELLAPKTGRRIPTINHIRAIQDEHSSVPLFGNIFTDITEQRQAYRVSRRLAEAHTFDEILQAVVENTFLKDFDNVSLYFFNRSWNHENPPENLQVTALWEGVPDSSIFKLGQVVPLSFFPEITENAPSIWSADVAADPHIPDEVRASMLQHGVRAAATFRLMIGDEWVGNLSGSSSKPQSFTDYHVQRLIGLIDQAATVVQNLRLLEAVQARARREQTLREITARVRNSMDPDTILRMAVRELGSALGRQTFIRIGSAEQLAKKPEQNGDSPKNGHSTSGMNGEGGR